MTSPIEPRVFLVRARCATCGERYVKTIRHNAAGGRNCPKCKDLSQRERKKIRAARGVAGRMG